MLLFVEEYHAAWSPCGTISPRVILRMKENSDSDINSYRQTLRGNVSPLTVDMTLIHFDPEKPPSMSFFFFFFFCCHDSILLFFFIAYNFLSVLFCSRIFALSIFIFVFFFFFFFLFRY